jgi:O-antigen ligase
MKNINNRIFEIFYLIGLFTLPLFYWAGFPIPYEVPKVILFYCWVELLVVVVLFNIRKIRRKSLDMPLLVFLLVFVGVVLLASLFGLDFEKSFVGNYFRMDGIVTLISLIVFSLITSFYLNPEFLRKVFSTVLISSTITSLVFLFNLYKLAVLKSPIPNFEGVPGISFGNPVFLSGFLVVTLPYIYWMVINNKRLKKILFLTCLLIQIIAILLTETWGGMAGILLFLILVFLFSEYKYKTMASLIFTLCFSVSIYLYFINQSNLQKASSNILIAESRQRILIKGLLAFKKKPILGWGWANFDYAFKSVDYPIHIENDKYVDKAHSNLVEILVTTGILGFTIYILIIGRLLTIYKRRGDEFSKILLMSLIIYLFHSQTNVISISEEIIFWIILANALKTNLQF